MALDFSMVFVFAAILATFFGGMLAVQMKKYLKLMVAFSAGLLVGIAFFDLIPEAFQLLPENFFLVSFSLLAGFSIYFFLEKFVLMHSCSEPHECETHSHQGFTGIIGLVLHRLMDGIVLGIALKANPATALLVGIAITIHSIPDGINSATVLLLKKSNSLIKWQIGVSIALLAGFIISIFLNLPESILGMLLAFVAGWFLYLGASDLLPEAHKEQSVKALIATIAGFIVIILIIVLLPKV